MTAAIRFNRQTDPHPYLSNFYYAVFHVNNVAYKTSEHYFQAQKFSHVPAYFGKIVACDSPMIAARLGRSRKQPLRTDWNEVRDDVMREAIRFKFTQNIELKQQLLDTGEAELIEHRKADSYWGDGGDGSGLNKLGLLLMELRQQLCEEIE
jgi:hypothetical protein